jgi:hypothetical protein
MPETSLEPRTRRLFRVSCRQFSPRSPQRAGRAQSPQKDTGGPHEFPPVEQSFLHTASFAFSRHVLSYCSYMQEQLLRYDVMTLKQEPVANEQQ